MFRNGKPSHGGDGQTFEVMTSTCTLETYGLVASLLATILYQRNYDRNHKSGISYSTEFEIKDIRDTARSASYHDIQLEIDSENRLIMNHHDQKLFQFPHCETLNYLVKVPSTDQHGRRYYK
jgi:hypothetical protein